MDAGTHERVSAHLSAGRVTLAADVKPFARYEADGRERVAFAHDPTGACVFLASDGTSLCAIHRDVGEAALPITCRQFPRAVIVAEDGVDVTLSHYCPTAAARLVDWGGPVSIVEDPLCLRGRELEGLDTRRHVPPLVRPGVMCAMDEWRWIETAIVGVFANATSSWRACTVTARWLERLTAWSVGDGSFAAFSIATLADADDPHLEARSAADHILAHWHLAREAVPLQRAARGITPPVSRAVADAADALDAWTPAVTRYLAAKAFASWMPWHASRLATFGRALRLAHHVLVVEVARRGACDRQAVLAAVRQADLLLMHEIDVAALVTLLEQTAARP